MGCNILSFLLHAKGGLFDGRTHSEAVHGPDCCVALQMKHCLRSAAHGADPSNRPGCCLAVSFQSEKEGSDIIQGSFALIRRRVR